jgi:DnaJ-class molecular chaperone
MANSNGSEASQTQMNPGDEAAPGTPGTAEDLCPTCHGSRQVDGRACENCGGTGRIIRGIGGA